VGLLRGGAKKKEEPAAKKKDKDKEKEEDWWTGTQYNGKKFVALSSAPGKVRPLGWLMHVGRGDR
jgi:hypothetical protein